MTIKIPTKATLKKYGIDAETWMKLLESQDWVCVICKKVPKSGIFVIDHFHKPGWKKMRPEDRKKYIRGILCRFCNSHCVGRFMNLEKAKNVVEYLSQFTLPESTINPSNSLF